MFSLSDNMRYMLYNQPTDMRKSYHTLSGIVSNVLVVTGIEKCSKSGNQSAT